MAHRGNDVGPPRAGRIERAVAWLVLGTALAWGISVGGTWIGARPWLAEWDRREIERLPAPDALSWRVGDRVFTGARTDWSRPRFEQSVIGLQAMDEPAPPAPPATPPAATPVAAPDWFVRALRRNDLPGPDGATPPAVRTATIIEVRGGWPWRTVVNRSIRFEPGIVIEAMDTPPLSVNEGPLRLPVFPRPWPLLAMGAIIGATLAWMAGAVGCWWRLRRARSGVCPRCGRAGPARPARRDARRGSRGRRVALALRTGFVFAAVAVATIWIGTILAASRLDRGVERPDAVTWVERVAVDGTDTGWRRRSTEVRGWWHRTTVTELLPVERRAGGTSPPLRPVEAWIAEALAHGDAGGRRFVREQTAGWPWPAVRRRTILADMDAPTSMPSLRSVGGPLLDPVWPGLLLDALLVFALVGLAGWCVLVRARWRRLRRRPPPCPACG